MTPKIVLWDVRNRNVNDRVEINTKNPKKLKPLKRSENRSAANPRGSRPVASQCAVCRGELMFSSASRHNTARWHMKTSDTVGLKRAVRSRSTTSRTWSPIGEEKLRSKDIYALIFNTKR
ncbi:hypothetical protein AOLI_G00220970 [Acnodon oligacanthus]